MTKYREKPGIIEAFRFGIDPEPKWFQEKITINDIVIYKDSSNVVTHCTIFTPKGIIRSYVEDYIVIKYPWEIKVYKPSVFEELFEEINESISAKEILKTSQDWQEIHNNVKVLDPDGWNRENFTHSWFNELITENEYIRRAGLSTCKYKINDW